LAINFTLPIGAASEVVTVVGGASLINMQDGGVSTVIDRQFAEQLPLNRPSFQTLRAPFPKCNIFLRVMALRSPSAFEILKRVGTLIALTYVLTLDNPHRFRRSRDAGCFLGLHPGRSNSGNSEPQLHISKEGDGYVRILMVQGAHYILV
jgi:hypothetical protein